MIRWIVLLKGFAMGAADIVPGVSGGTVAFITGIYDELLKSIAQIDKEFVKKIYSFKIKEAFEHINYRFMIPLSVGVLSAIILLSRFIHFFLNDYPVQTWSLFFGLIIASIVYIYKQIDHPLYIPNIGVTFIGAVVGAVLVDLVPIHTANTLPLTFLAGMIAICAMILPGISGSFILLILGKYEFVIGALKNPFFGDNLLVILVFCIGCLIGLLSFTKVLTYLLSKWHNPMMCLLTGFMIGALKKIWPWKDILETTQVGNKVLVLKEQNYIPAQLDSEVVTALAIAIFGFAIVFIIEKIGKKYS